MPFSLHRNPPFRAEHLGSLLRGEELLQKRADVDAKKAKESDLERIEDRDVKEIVKIQQELGFHAITDGEYRRHSEPDRASDRKNHDSHHTFYTCADERI